MIIKLFSNLLLENQSQLMVTLRFQVEILIKRKKRLEIKIIIIVIMDLLLFGGSLSVGLFVGLTLKKHQVYLVPQSLGIMKTNR